MQHILPPSRVVYRVDKPKIKLNEYYTGKLTYFTLQVTSCEHIQSKTRYGPTPKCFHSNAKWAVFSNHTTSHTRAMFFLALHKSIGYVSYLSNATKS